MHPKYWKRPHVLRAPVDSDGSAGAGGESSQASLVDSFSSFFTDPSQEESAAPEVTETPEAAAERLATEEEASANQNSAEEGKQDQAAENADAFTIEVDGKEVKLTKAELAEHYKNGLRQKDYTQKTMEVSEQRKAAEAEKAAAKAERDTYAQRLQNMAVTHEALQREAAQKLTVEFAESDPVAFMVEKHRFDQRQAELQQAHVELQRINGERQKEHAEAQSAYQQQQMEQLHAKLPEWKDAAKAKAEAGQIKDFLVSQGFTAQDIDGIADHRFILMARQAMQHDALMKRAKEAAGKVAKAAPKVERPGAQVAATDGRTAHMKQFAKTGSRDDAARAFAEIFG